MQGSMTSAVAQQWSDFARTRRVSCSGSGYLEGFLVGAADLLDVEVVSREAAAQLSLSQCVLTFPRLLHQAGSKVPSSAALQLHVPDGTHRVCEAWMLASLEGTSQVLSSFSSCVAGDD